MHSIHSPIPKSIMKSKTAWLYGCFLRKFILWQQFHISVSLNNERMHKFFNGITNLSNDALMQLLLYGDQDHSYDLNKNMLKLSGSFTKLVALTKISQASVMSQSNHHVR